MNGRQDLRKRTKDFALRIVKLYGALPKSAVAQVLGKQILRSGTSVGAQYREACRAKSNADFVTKIEGALQELDETQYWLELLMESGIVRRELLTDICEEANELTSILVASAKTAKTKK